MPSSRTPRQARTSIYLAFKTYWDAASESGVKIAWDAVDFKTTGVEYLLVQLRHAAGTIAALGNEKYRRIAVLTININTPEGSGQKRSDEIGEAVLGFLETMDIAGIRVRDPGLVEAGITRGFYQSSGIATIEYDALRT